MSKYMTDKMHPALVGTVDVNTAAELLGVHGITVRRWIAQGLLPAKRLGPKLIRIRRADLDAFITPTGGAA